MAAAYGRVLALMSALVLTAEAGGKHYIYSGNSVHGIKIWDQSDASLLHDLELKYEVDIWQHGYPGKRDAHVMLPLNVTRSFLDELDSKGLTHYLLVPDVSKILDKSEEERLQWKSSRNSKSFPFEDYPRYEEVNEYLENIAAEYPDIVSIETAGPSYEGRLIKYLKISTTNFEDTSKPVYFLDAMIHAREWVTTPVALYVIHRLVVELRDQDRDLLEQIDWIVLPIVNPDGYEYTHTTERLWRRTRSFNPEVSTTCYGVDGNRNFDSNFANFGVSADPCNNLYPGTTPFSEPETAYVRDIMFNHLDRIVLYLNIHSYGNLVLFAYGNGTYPPNALEIHLMGSVFGAAVDTHKLPQAEFYLVGNSAGVLYGSSGTARDYGSEVGIPFSFTLELPSLGYYFEVPPAYIGQINEETWHGIAATARASKSYYDARAPHPDT